jgi:hypothetical protein
VDNSKYNIITGHRRSGTSLLMLCLRQSGIPIIGSKFAVLLEDNPDKQMRHANPNGYWELGTITVKTGLKPQHEYIGINGDLIKIIFDAIYFSDPNLINKTLIITRNPRQVLNSLIKANLIIQQDLPMAIYGMIQRTYKTYDFLIENKIPYKIINYDELLQFPKNTLRRATQFLEKGNHEEGAKYIDKSLNRSQPLKGNYEGITTLELLHQYQIENKTHEILKINLNEIEQRIKELNSF